MADDRVRLTVGRYGATGAFAFVFASIVLLAVATEAPAADRTSGFSGLAPV